MYSMRHLNMKLKISENIGDFKKNKKFDAISLYHVLEHVHNLRKTGKKIVDLGFPKNAIITMIKRDDKYITPNGSTVINLNDALIILYDKPEGLEKIKESLFVT